MGLGHILGQFILVRMFVIPDDGVFYFISIFLYLHLYFHNQCVIVSRLISPSN